MERGCSGTGWSTHERVTRGLKFSKAVHWWVCILLWRQRGEKGHCSTKEDGKKEENVEEAPR